MTILKSIGAGFVGILVGVVLSVGTDAIFEHFGVLPKGNIWVSAWLIWFVLFYRTVYNIIGTYIVVRLAPNYPMRHAIVVGILGTLVSIMGALATKDMNLGPQWYPWTLAALTLPSAYFAGWLHTRNK